LNGRTVVIDTNVAVVANENHPLATEQCIASCVNAIRNLVKSGQIAIDSDSLLSG